jgi:hypothetical protein
MANNALKGNTPAAENSAKSENYTLDETADIV